MVHSKRCILNGLDSVKLTELGVRPMIKVVTSLLRVKKK